MSKSFLLLVTIILLPITVFAAGDGLPHCNGTMDCFFTSAALVLDSTPGKLAGAFLATFGAAFWSIREKKPLNKALLKICSVIAPLLLFLLLPIMHGLFSLQIYILIFLQVYFLGLAPLLFQKYFAPGKWLLVVWTMSMVLGMASLIAHPIAL